MTPRVEDPIIDMITAMAKEKMTRERDIIFENIRRAI